MDLTIAQIYTKLLPLVGQEYVLPTTANKGLAGHFLEDLLEIPHTSNCLDCIDGEVKIFPLKTLKNGKCVPKETVAITMLSPDEVRTKDFHASKCFKKLKNVLMVPYERKGNSIYFRSPKIIDSQSVEFTEFYKTIEADYKLIRQGYIETGRLTSETGVLLQNRTKGPGGSKTRAFYLKKKALLELFSL